MQSAIRFIGIANVAVWFGAAVLFTVAVGPAFFSSEMLAFLPRPYAGRAAQVIIERYFLLQQWCGAIALLHLLVEYFYSGRQADRLTLGLTSGLFVVALIGGLWLAPQMAELHRLMYAPGTTLAQQAAARSTFRLLHGLSQTVNLAVMVGVGGYLWLLTRPARGFRLTAGG